MNVLDYIRSRWVLDVSKPVIEIPDFGRDGLARMFADLGFEAGAEIGVQNGDFSEILCESNPDAVIYSIDGWHHYSGYHFITTQKQQDENKERALKRLLAYSNNQILDMDSVEAAQEFEDGFLDFVYIDANHDYSHVTEDLTEWCPKVRSGGIISGHDYVQRRGRFTKDMQVVEALRDFMTKRNISPLILLGRKEIVEGEIRDQPRSWMFVNP